MNNACIVSGAPPNVTGITGNFFLDPQTREEVMMNSRKYLRCATILAAATRNDRRVAMITAKDKLQDLLLADLRGIAFSAERASDVVEATHGISNVESLVGQPTPDSYSAEASLFVLRAAASDAGCRSCTRTSVRRVLRRSRPGEAGSGAVVSFCPSGRASCSPGSWATRARPCT